MVLIQFYCSINTGLEELIGTSCISTFRACSKQNCRFHCWNICWIIEDSSLSIVIDDDVARCNNSYDDYQNTNDDIAYFPFHTV